MKSNFSTVMIVLAKNYFFKF